MELVEQKKTGGERESNIELFRIVLMLLIISHHLVVNSSVKELFDFGNIMPNMIFLQIFGMFGKTVINCFTFVTGFYMIKSKISLRKFLRIYFQVKFYYLLFYVLFILFGYEIFSVKGLVKTVFCVIYEANSLYVGTYIVLYLFIPFLNIFAKNMDQKQYKLFLAMTIIYFTIFSSLFMHDTFDFLGWMMVTYFIGGYIRLYGMPFLGTLSKSIVTSIVSILIIIMSILFIDFIGFKYGISNYYYFVSNGNKLLALLCSVALFSFFKKIRIKKSKVINTIAGATFGVLLFHANSDTMRNFLWKIVFDIRGHYTSSFLPLYAVGVVCCVFVIGTVIELIRKNTIEKWLFAYLDKNKAFDMIENKIKGKLL